MLIRLPINLSNWNENIDSYSKLTIHPFLNVIVVGSSIKLSGMPYVTVRVLLKSNDLNITTPYLDFDNTDWSTLKNFSVFGTGILHFSDNDDIIIPSSVAINNRTYVLVAGDQLVVAGDLVYM